MANEDKLDQLTAIVEDLRSRVYWLQQAVYDMMTGSRPTAGPAPSAERPPWQEPRREPRPEPAKEPAPAATAREPVAAAPSAAREGWPPPSARAGPPMSTAQVIETVGLVLGYVGIAALFAALAYFLQWSVTEAVFSVEMATLLGVVAGLAMMGLGEIARPHYRGFAHLLHGGGLAFVYATLYFGWIVYDELNAETGVLLTSIVTAGAMGFAVWRVAPVTAVIAAAGGFTTAFFLGADEGQRVLFLAYLLIVNAGTLLVALRHRWPGLSLLSLGAVVLCVVAHVAAQYYEIPAPLQAPFFGFMTGYYAEFLLAVLLPLWRGGQEVREMELGIVIGSTAFYYIMLAATLFQAPAWQPALGAFTFLVALLLFGLGWMSSQLGSKQRLVVAALHGMGLVFLTLAIPIWFKSVAPALLWCGEASVVLFLGLRGSSAPLRYTSWALYVLAVGRVVLYDTFVWEWTPGMSERLLAYIGAIAMSVLFAILYTLHRDQLSDEERSVVPAFYVCANVLGLVAVSMEVWDYCTVLAKNQWLAETLLSGVWAVWGLGVVWGGLAKDLPNVWWAGVALFGLACLKLLLVDLPQLGHSYLALGFSVVGVVLLVAAWRYVKSSRTSKEKEPTETTQGG
jgi:uncharacterized membrane protein